MGVYRMESKIPLPTDNIYKFCALFGVLLLLTSIVSIVWVGNSTNETVCSLIKEYESIPGSEEEKDETSLAKTIEALINAQVENRELYNKGLGAAIGISILLMFYGFREWYTKIQPKQSEYFDLQIQKLKQEIENNTDSQSTSN